MSDQSLQEQYLELLSNFEQVETERDYAVYHAKKAIENYETKHVPIWSLLETLKRIAAICPSIKTGNKSPNAPGAK